MMKALNMQKTMTTIKALARMVKIEHSIFALPFAYFGYFAASGRTPKWGQLALLTLAMVAVRTYAMTANRLFDLPFDRANPRTARRELVTGEVSISQAWACLGVTALVFVLACWGLNALCLILSPVVLVWAAGYSLTKRFTWLCHLWLGSVLGLAPVAGSLAFAPQFLPGTVMLGLAVTLWVAGFDMLYCTQDAAFDAGQGLHSAATELGVAGTFRAAGLLHLLAVANFALAGWLLGLGFWFWPGLLLCGAILFGEHLLVGPTRMDRLNLAFFTLNGVVAVVLCGFGIAAAILR